LLLRHEPRGEKQHGRSHPSWGINDLVAMGLRCIFPSAEAPTAIGTSVCSVGDPQQLISNVAQRCLPVQSSPSVIDGPDLDMGQKELGKLVEGLTGRVTALEKERSPANTSKGKWDRNSVIALLSLAVSVVGLPLVLAAWIEPHLQNDLKNDVKIEVAEQLKEPLKKLEEIAGDVREIKGKLEVLDRFFFMRAPLYRCIHYGSTLSTCRD
jgi:hypothetical protein